MRITGLSLAACGLLAASALNAVNTNSFPVPPAADVVRARSQLKHLSPVEYFRGLLGMAPAERDKALAEKPPAARAAILAKIKEYEALPRAVREARLCQTELHWELGLLMKLPAAERNGRLKEVSPLYRPMLARLLQEWDEVPVNTQKALLEKQDFIGMYLRLQGSPAGAQKEMLDNMPPGRRAVWEREMGRWQALSEEDRANLCAQFQHFCAMSGEQQRQTVGPLAEGDKRAMEQALHAYDVLPPDQRAACINSFRKFAIMAPADRTQFLDNALRWESMTRHERQLWRQLVRQLPQLPPVPAGMPPLPPVPAQVRKGGMRAVPPLPPSVMAPVVMALSTNDLR
jgi:hypothetical protein